MQFHNWPSASCTNRLVSISFSKISVFKICYKFFSKLEYEFITKAEDCEDGTKFLSVLSENIRILKKFKNEFLALQKAFRKYPQTYEKKIGNLN